MKKFKLQKVNIFNTHGYSLTKSDEYRRTKNNDIKNLAKEYDKIGYLSSNLGNELNDLFDENSLIGIHKTGYTMVDEYFLKRVFKEGLRNNDSSALDGNLNCNNITRFVDLTSSFIVATQLIKDTNAYRNSLGCFIVKIPASYIDNNSKDVKPIFYQKNKYIYLLPEFIYGYIPVHKAKANKIIRNPYYKDAHYLKNENLIYDCEIKDIPQDIQIKTDISVKAKILLDSYFETLNNHGSLQARKALNELIMNNKETYFSNSINRANLYSHVCYANIKEILKYAIDHSDEYGYIEGIDYLVEVYENIYESYSIKYNKN